MSNLFSHVLGIMLLIPGLLFSFDLYMLQTATAGLEAFASTLAIRTSNRGINYTHVDEAESMGYRLVCLSACSNPQIGQTQTFVLELDFTPLFISSEDITLIAKRSYIIGYY